MKPKESHQWETSLKLKKSIYPIQCWQGIVYTNFEQKFDLWNHEKEQAKTNTKKLFPNEQKHTKTTTSVSVTNVQQG